MEAADEAANPGLKYYNMQYKGFFAVKATKEEHVAEFFVVDPETILTDYANARSTSNSIVADFMCDAQLTTTAGQRGSLTRSDDCSVIEFDTKRSSMLGVPFPDSSTEGAVELSDCGYDECEFAVVDDLKSSVATSEDDKTASGPESSTLRVSRLFTVAAWSTICLLVLMLV